MNNIVPFNFKGNQVRVVDRDGDPWFVAADVCAVLEIVNPSDAIKRLDDDESTLARIEGNHRPINLINESGLYSLILRSDKPEAKPFRKWVTAEVLPAIRKTGRYETPESPVHALLRSVQLMVEHEERLNQQQAQIAAIAQKQEEMNGDTGYMTALAFCRREGVAAPLEFAKRLGRMATEKCKRLNIRTGKVPDERWGTVNSYPVEILRECYQAIIATGQAA